MDGKGVAAGMLTMLMSIQPLASRLRLKATINSLQKETQLKGVLIPPQKVLSAPLQ